MAMLDSDSMRFLADLESAVDEVMSRHADTVQSGAYTIDLSVKTYGDPWVTFYEEGWDFV